MAQDNEVKKISDLVPDAGNYNRGTEKGRKLIGKSLKKLGAGRSILIDKDGNVIAGNKTLEGAAAAGIDEVIVVKTTGRQIVAVQRTDLEIGSKKGREMALADNATGAANLSWDLDAMTADGWTETDLSGWGVDMPEGEPVKTEAFEDDFEQPAEIEEIQTDIVAGDLFEIGEHRLLCGDSTKREAVDRLMGGEKADMVFTDPPYGVDYDGGHAVKGVRREKLKNDSSADIYSQVLPLCFLFSINDAPLYLWYSDSKSIEVLSAVLSAGYELRNNIIWNKNLAQFGAIGAQYKTKHEPCIYAFKKGHKVGWCGPNNEVSVWDISRSSKNEYHPTQKPIGLCARALGNHKAINVLDLFLGSGSTMVAAHQLNRRCFGCEISPKYCQVILDRMLKLDPNIEIKKNGEPYQINTVEIR